MECQALAASWRAAQVLRPGHRDGAHAIRLLFKLPLRQVEGFLRSLFDLMGLALDVPDHTTLSRRARKLKVTLRVPRTLGRIDLVIDSSGLAICRRW
ncbi:MAG TPA: hypothetical protein EYP98_18410 [Planctomycetes bacterium]|nr:hypothetical protein [Planctomycetota bacterium]